MPTAVKHRKAAAAVRKANSDTTRKNNQQTMTEKMSNLITRTAVGILFVTVMVGGIIWRPDTMVLLFAVITGMTLWEYGGLVNENIDDTHVNRFISTVAGVYFFLAVTALQIRLVEGFAVFIPYVLTMVYLFIGELYLQNKNAINCWAYTVLGQFYIAFPLSLISVLAFRTADNGTPSYNALLPLSVFIFLWTNDTGAYCSGSLFGRHKLFPRISPGKTWEGSIGGGILVLTAAGIIGWLSSGGDTSAHSLSIAEWLGLGLVTAVFGTWGDLVESLFKRTIGIKDSGNVLPGHGGMLDRFDSSLLAIPAAVVYLYTLALV